MEGTRDQRDNSQNGSSKEEKASIEKRTKGSVVIPPYMKAVSGSLGGTMEACCLQPIDVIKTRLQLDRSGSYQGIAHCGRTIIRSEGVRALWKGLTPFATHLTLKYTLRMGTNALLQSAFADPETRTISHRARLMAGFGAGVCEALLIVTPFEVVENKSCHLPVLISHF
ncbi:Mitochondrial succinate-fumarate transporter 1 [Nymphaea thermarum]|nr:Mitochondrial succinate-fumarate transporter 1 [Nymphaea thermarum]